MPSVCVWENVKETKSVVFYFSVSLCMTYFQMCVCVPVHVHVAD